MSFEAIIKYVDEICFSVSHTLPTQSSLIVRVIVINKDSLKFCYVEVSKANQGSVIPSCCN